MFPLPTIGEMRAAQRTPVPTSRNFTNMTVEDSFVEAEVGKIGKMDKETLRPLLTRCQTKCENMVPLISNWIDHKGGMNGRM